MTTKHTYMPKTHTHTHTHAEGQYTWWTHLHCKVALCVSVLEVVSALQIVIYHV